MIKTSKRKQIIFKKIQIETQKRNLKNKVKLLMIKVNKIHF